jgi:Ca-activated chloride channel homolog
MQASIRLDHQLLAVDGEHHVHAMLELQAPVPAGDGGGPPLHLALVVDRSGSMAGAKLEVARRCAAWLAERLRPVDQLALVDYDDTARLLLPLAPADAAAARAAIAAIRPGGATNLSGGWLKGVEELRRAPADATRKALLLSDGIANRGLTDRGELAELAGSIRAAGIGTTTIGFGDDFDEDLLTAMADAGGGEAHWAQTPDAAPTVFHAELEALTRLVAQNVSVEIRPGPQVELLGVLNDYPAFAVPGGVQVQLGDAYGGDRRRLVFELQVPHLAALGPVTVAELVLRYVAVAGEVREHTLTLPLVANAVSASEAAAAAPDPEVREETLLLRAARARDQALRLSDSGHGDEAGALLRAEARSLRELGGAALEQEALALDDAATAVGDPAAAPAPHLRKRLRYDSRNLHRRRS